MPDPSIAVVGSGPSGCYIAQSLRRAFRSAQIVVFERLPVPYGLLRYGVAPDHLGTKNIVQQFDRIFLRDDVEFRGNVHVGVSLPMEEIQAAFDIVIIATGLYGDREMSVPGEGVEGVHGSGRITRFLNDHPDEFGFMPALGHCPIIVGNGNVAIDIARMFTKSPDDFEPSEISSHSLAHLAAQKFQEIHIVGRSSVALAKFDSLMIKELSKLEGAKFVLGADSKIGIPETVDQHNKCAAIAELVHPRRSADASRLVVLHFGWTPTEIISVDGDFAGLKIRSTDGTKEKKLTGSSLVKAVGFCEIPASEPSRESLKTPETDLHVGYMAKGLYCTGWFRRGPTGTIPENRLDAKTVADQIVADWRPNIASTKKGLAALAPLLKESVSFSGWKAIDAVERTGLQPGRTRAKLRDIDSMIRAANGIRKNEI